MKPWCQRQSPCPGCHYPRPEIRSLPYKLYRRTFAFHFKNLRLAFGRNTTFLCYKVDREDHGSLVPLRSGVFRNQGYGERRLHAELCFIHWLHDSLQLWAHPHEHLVITWFVSWSPCPNCAKQVAGFLASHPNVCLTIYAARLYYYFDEMYQDGLRLLQGRGVTLKIMSFREFKYCWENFVYSDKGKPFWPWKELYRNYRLQLGLLDYILQ